MDYRYLRVSNLMTRGIAAQFPPVTPEDLANWLVVQIEDLKHEAEQTYSFAITQSLQPRGLFVQTLYAYVERSFSILDRLSLHDLPKKAQTVRMVDVLERRIGVAREPGNVAVHIWRHGLMHSAEARRAIAPTGQAYRWLLHWGSADLPEDLNWTFSVDPRGERILNLSLMHVLAGLRKATDSFATDINSKPDARSRAEAGFNTLQLKDKIRFV